jgi:hypothetical protein
MAVRRTLGRFPGRSHTRRYLSLLLQPLLIEPSNTSMNRYIPTMRASRVRWPSYTKRSAFTRRLCISPNTRPRIRGCLMSLIMTRAMLRGRARGCLFQRGRNVELIPLVCVSLFSRKAECICANVARCCWTDRPTPYVSVKYEKMSPDGKLMLLALRNSSILEEPRRIPS